MIVHQTLRLISASYRLKRDSLAALEQETTDAEGSLSLLLLLAFFAPEGRLPLGHELEGVSGELEYPESGVCM